MRLLRKAKRRSLAVSALSNSSRKAWKVMRQNQLGYPETSSSPTVMKTVVRLITAMVTR